ncbi:DUF899 family protein [Rhodococcus chondri]|uniref:DUF899 family protein n=1 Tax=Rhodococcus chondri TaxID=3065941 RepID=A0ABU7JYD6_9NOCA|nr:DUF899 family protein [Rhodococcus sp. CC-R104]MEE2035025.1 DUF899 family protein [Rhodococcus sp. CC-R104]
MTSSDPEVTTRERWLDARRELHRCTKLEHYRQRMGWVFPWYSSLGSDFNYDFHGTLDAAVAPVEYNYKDQAELEQMNPAWQGWSGEEHGVSAFLRRGERIFHTYSGYARSTDMLLGTYHWLDLTALGRQEDREPQPRRGDDPFMSWLRGHDEYEPDVITGATTPD